MVVQLLKPGKLANLGKSCHLITTLSPVVEILEALLLRTFTHHLSLDELQHGFRKVYKLDLKISVDDVEIPMVNNHKILASHSKVCIYIVRLACSL